jgi:predicted DNA-binding protein
MEPETQYFSAVESRSLSSRTIRTTLYNLVEAINEELEPGEDWMISAALVDLVRTGRLRFLGESLR